MKTNLHPNFVSNCKSIKGLQNSKIQSKEAVSQKFARVSEAKKNISTMKEYWLSGCKMFGKDAPTVQTVYKIYTDMVDMLAEAQK